MIGRSLSHYEILGRLGRGGMGEVYRARDRSLDREVALKVIPPEVASRPDRLERFEREAKTLAKMSHPNIVTIFTVEMAEGIRFLTMEKVKGESLDRLIPTGGYSLEEFLRLAVPMADALRAAHQKGIIHRDLKPSNIMLDEEGRPKILDFGLAKLERPLESPEMTQLATELATGEGMVIGTVPYMSPEQIESKPVDPRSDIFSLGIVFHEMATGRRPFEGDSGPALISSILKDTPRPVSEVREDFPRQLGRIVRHCLEKNPDKRFQTARDMHNELVDLRDELRSGAKPPAGTVAEALPPVAAAAPAAEKRPPWGWVAAIAAVIVAGVSLWLALGSRQHVQRARVLVPEIERLADAADYVAAYELALEVERQLPNDPVLAERMPEISDLLSVTTEPTGASVYLQRLPHGEDEVTEPRLLGTTPLEAIWIARADHRMELKKDGYFPGEQVLSSALNRAQAPWGGSIDLVVDEALQPIDDARTDMVFVPGGQYQLRGRQFALMDTVTLDDFWIDRYEVSNQRFRKFIRAGGYSNRSYWKHPFLEDRRELSFDEAISRFTDRSGLPGPREWSGQEFPDGQTERHPVTDITWYEAAAFAEYEGKALPTIYQWEMAARAGRLTHFEGTVMPWGLMSVGGSIERRANFLGRGTKPVDSYAFGISPVGAYNMAGNVEEWLINERGSGRATAGGSWNDAWYLFTDGGARPELGAWDTVGFRCVSRPAAAAADQGSARIEPRRDIAPLPSAADDATYRGFLSHYRYDRTPLEVEVLETVDGPDWSREKLAFPGVEVEPILAYLYLPKRGRQPFQTLYWMVSGTVTLGGRTAAKEVEAILAPQIKGGRAVMAVVPKYGTERRDPPPPPPGERPPVWSRNRAIGKVTEYRIGLDYLETREEIDLRRVAHVGFSSGATRTALIFAALEPRIRSFVFIGGGLYETGRLPEVNAINFVPRIDRPVLVLSGWYDEVLHVEPLVRDLFERLPGPKRLELVESGHLPPLEIRNPIITRFLDETLGPVGSGRLPSGDEVADALSTPD